MKLSTSLITMTLFLATTSFASAATDTTDIEIQVTKDAYINFTGSLQGNTSKILALSDVDAATTSLGSLGTESNTTGSCSVAFTSDNDFKMVHDSDSALFLHGASNYSIAYEGSTIGSGNANTVSLANCNNIASSFDMTSPALPAVVTAGTYKDIIHVTVTTQ